MTNNDENIEMEEMPLDNGKVVFKYIEQDGSTSTKFEAGYVCEYIYDKEDNLLGYNISNNPYYGKNVEKEVEQKVHFYLTEGTINKLNELADLANKSKSEIITQLIEDAFNK